MRVTLTFLIALACFAASAGGDQFVVGKRGTNSDYPFRGC